MKRIALAQHNYHDVYQQFSPVVHPSKGLSSQPHPCFPYYGSWRRHPVTSIFTFGANSSLPYVESGEFIIS